MGRNSQAEGFYVSGVVDEPVQGAPCHLGHILCGVLCIAGQRIQTA